MTSGTIRQVPVRAAALAALAAALALGACRGREGNLSEIDNEIAANDADPALTSALEDQIMVDPALSQQSNRLAVRPPSAPPQSQYPLDPPSGAGAGEARQASLSSGAGGARQVCGGGSFAYGNEWARRLPPEFPLYPGASVTEAAANEAGDCRLRIVSFRTDQPWRQVLDFYSARASAAGFSAEHQRRGTRHVLGGANAGRSGAFFLVLTPVAGGTEAALVVNNGR